MAAKGRAVLAMVAAMLVAMACVLLLVQHDAVRATSLDSVYVGNWRTDENYLPCEEDPNCGYGKERDLLGLLRLEQATSTSTARQPTAILLLSPSSTTTTRKASSTPILAPETSVPTLPFWVQEMGDYPGMVRKVWPDYRGSENSISASSAAKSVGAQQLYMYLTERLVV
eukprot:755722-Hanusia_phi.AAC.3